MKNKQLTLFKAKYWATFCMSFLLINQAYSQTDDCTNPTPLTVNASSISGTTAGATQTMSAITCFYTGNADDDVFYQFTTSVAGYYTVYSTGTGNMDVVIDVRTGACPGSTLACADATGTGGSESVTFNAMANTTYYVRIYDYYDIGEYSNASNFNIRVASQYPIITTQPQNQSTCVNTGISYTVAASTYASQTYQWQRSPDNSTWYTISNNNPTGVTYTGSTTNTLNVTGTAAVNNYYYRCQVTASGYSTLSNVATLAINVAPAITSNPINNSMFTGTNANMSITATGAGLTFQWQYNNGGSWASVTNGTPSGASYTNANTNILNIAGVSATGNYQYRCVVSGSCTPAATSSAATLTVYQSSSDSWSVSGNTGTNATTNFIGTSDATDLTIKTNNQTQIKFEYGVNGSRDKEVKLYDKTNYPYVYFNGTSNKIGFGSEPDVHDCYENLPERLNTSGAVKMHANTGNAVNDEKCLIVGHDGANGVIDLHIDGGIEGATPGKLLLGWNSGYDVAIAPDPNPVHDIVGSSSLYVHGKLGVGADAINSTHKLNVGGSVNATEFYKNGQALALSQWINGSTFSQDINYTLGNVGIGTTTEDAVYGNRSGQDINGNLIVKNNLLLSGDNNNSAGLIFRNSISNGVTTPRYNGDVAMELVDILSEPLYQGKPVRGLNFWLPWSNGAQSLHNYRLFINSYESTDPNEKVKPGFIGIGTARPEAPLHLASDNPSIILEDNLIESGSTALGKCHLRASNGALRLISDADVAIFLDADNSQSDESFSIFANNENAVSPAVPLFKVNKDGVTSTKELVVDLDPSFWPDYVFKKGYKLMSINELELYILKNKHLPNVHSSEELKARGGLNIGEMQKIQMEKIEEIMLYIIQLKKENDELKKIVQTNLMNHDK